jgi:hypothetical protein
MLERLPSGFYTVTLRTAVDAQLAAAANCLFYRR